MNKKNKKLLLAATGLGIIAYALTQSSKAKAKAASVPQIGPGSATPAGRTPVPTGVNVPATPATPATPSTSSSAGILQVGMKGAAVKRLQQKLISLGYDLGPDGADGRFGWDTDKAVRAFQKDNNLGIDGSYGPNTARALRVSKVG